MKKNTLFQFYKINNWKIKQKNAPNISSGFLDVKREWFISYLCNLLV